MSATKTANTVLQRFAPGQRWYRGKYPILEIIHEPTLAQPHQYSNGILFVRDASEESWGNLVKEIA